MKKRVFLFLAILGFMGCKQEEVAVDLGYEYFPMEKGQFIEYEVTEIFHDKDLLPQHDTIRYRLKTKIGEEVIDNSGRNTREFFQYRYEIGNEDFTDQRVWTQWRGEKRGEIVEENQRKIRLVFPIKLGQEWNVNAFNPEDEWNVYYTNVKEEKTINELHFEETVKIVYDDFLTLVDYRKSHEIYAKGVGMIERKIKDLNISNFDTLQILKGKETFYRIVDFGKE